MFFFPLATVNNLRATVDRQRKDLLVPKAKLDSLKDETPATGVCACACILSSSKISLVFRLDFFTLEQRIMLLLLFKLGPVPTYFLNTTIHCVCL